MYLVSALRKLQHAQNQGKRYRIGSYGPASRNARLPAFYPGKVSFGHPTVPNQEKFYEPSGVVVGLQLGSRRRMASFSTFCDILIGRQNMHLPRPLLSGLAQRLAALQRRRIDIILIAARCSLIRTYLPLCLFCSPRSLHFTTRIPTADDRPYRQGC